MAPSPLAAGRPLSITCTILFGRAAVTAWLPASGGIAPGMPLPCGWWQPLQFWLYRAAPTRASSPVRCGEATTPGRCGAVEVR